MEKKNNMGLYIIIILCIVLTVAVCFIVFNKDNKINNQEEIKQTDISLNKDDNQKNESKEELLNQKEVEELLKKLSLLYKGTSSINDDGINLVNNIYQDKLIEYKDYDYQNGILVAFRNVQNIAATDKCNLINSFQYINETNTKVLKNLCDDNNAFNNEKINIFFPNIPIREVYNINYYLLNESYKNIFGFDKYIPKMDLYLNAPIYCKYINDDLLCFSTDGGYTSNQIQSSFIKASKIDNDIIIYENVMKDNKIKKYKSIFRMDVNNNYYWYSTEPINE